MTTSLLESPFARRQAPREPGAAPADSAWISLYRVAGAAALLSVGIIVLAVPVFVLSPLPSTVADWFSLFHRNWLLGLLDLDLLLLVAYLLTGLIYLALYGALRRGHESFMALATLCGLVSVTTYLASNTAFNMLWLSGQYAAATTDGQRAQLLAAGQAMLATWKGSAYDVSYVLGGIATLIIAVVMLRGRVFGRATAYVGLVLGVLMLVPATAGTIGLSLSLASLVPTVIWLILLARTFFQLAAPRQGDAVASAAFTPEVQPSKEAR